MWLLWYGVLYCEMLCWLVWLMMIVCMMMIDDVVVIV